MTGPPGRDADAAALERARLAYHRARARRSRRISVALACVAVACAATVGFMGPAAPWPAQVIAAVAGAISLGCVVVALRRM